MSCDAALSSFSIDRNFTDHIEHTVGQAAQKDVVAYCSLAYGYLETLRRVEAKREDIQAEIEAAKNDAFDHDITVFIKDLRKNLSHGAVSIVSWELSHSGTSTTGRMTFMGQELLNFGEWSNRSRRYVAEKEEENINIAQSIGEHFRNLNKFNEALTDLFARNIRPSEIDYHDIVDTKSKWGAQQFAKILLTQTGKGKDPYKYLHKFFDATTCREILRYPKNSKEQVDFIISLKSPRYACDDSLRKALYQAFSVQDLD